MAMAASFRGGASHRKRLGLQLCGGLREALLVRERRACGAPARLLCASASGGQPAGPGPGPGPASGAKRGPVTWLSVGLVGAVAGGLAWYYTDQREKQMKKTVSQVKSTGKPNLGGPWTLVDMHGVPRTERDYLGRYCLLYFGFTFCPDICPAELVKVDNILKQLPAKLGKKSPPLKPVFISVDPERDSLLQLRHYAQDFNPDIDYLTGTKEQVAVAARAYRVYFSKTEDHEEGEDYLVDHSIVLYLVGPDGKFLDFFTQRMSVEDCVARIAQHIASADK